MLNRRKMLSGLAGLPFIGWMFGGAEASTPINPDSFTTRKPQVYYSSDYSESKPTTLAELHINNEDGSKTYIPINQDGMRFSLFKTLPENDMGFTVNECVISFYIENGKLVRNTLGTEYSKEHTIKLSSISSSECELLAFRESSLME